jgi:hypothetical protein
MRPQFSSATVAFGMRIEKFGLDLPVSEEACCLEAERPGKR